MKDRADSAGNDIEPASDYKLSIRDCAKLAQWENSLLDLSMRNKLLN